MLGALLLRSLARGRGLLAGVVVLLAAFEISIVLQAASIEQAQTYELMGRMMPAFARRWMGDSIVALASFAGIVGFGYFHPMIVLVVSMVAAFVASEPAADVEGGQVDLLLSRPVARHWVVTRSALMLAVCPVGLLVVMMAATAVAVALFAPADAAKPSALTISILAVNLAAVAWSVGALSLAIASVTRRRSAAFGSAALVAVGLYFVNVLAASWRPAQLADLVSPFHYYQAPRILAGVFNPAPDLLMLLGGTAVLVAVSYWRFNVRDL